MSITSFVLGLSCFSSSVFPLGSKLRWVISKRSYFPMQAFNAMNVSLGDALSTSHTLILLLILICVLMSIQLKIFLVFLLISSFCGLFGSMLVSKYLEISTYFLLLISGLLLLWLDSTLHMTWILLIETYFKKKKKRERDLLHGPGYSLRGLCSVDNWKDVYSAVGHRVLYPSTGCCWFIVLRSSLSLLTFCQLLRERCRSLQL